LIDDEIRLLTISTFSSLTTLLSQFHHTNNIIISHNLPPSHEDNQDLSHNLPSHDLLSSCQIYYQYSVENYSIHLGEIISYILFYHIFYLISSSHFISYSYYLVDDQNEIIRNEISFLFDQISHLFPNLIINHLTNIKDNFIHKNIITSILDHAKDHLSSKL